MAVESPTVESLKKEIAALKKQRGAVIMGHYYQTAILQGDARENPHETDSSQRPHRRSTG